ncbi:hypothetical protein ACQCT6_10490 [Cytobacillus gottheilii]|uniref:hypothetical protein n=1 Tax=Cytobacillus gottheilii TaxID=859144 RepID=UPI003CFAA619
MTVTQQGVKAENETYMLTSNTNNIVKGNATFNVTTVNPAATQTFEAANGSVIVMASRFANQLELDNYVVTSIYNSITAKQDIMITSTLSGDQSDLSFSWTESGTTALDGVTPQAILDPASFKKMHDGSNGNVEIATLELSGTTGTGTIYVQVGFRTFIVAVEGGDTAEEVADKVFGEIGVNGVNGYTAVNNGNGTITFTSADHDDVEDLTVLVTN